MSLEMEKQSPDDSSGLDVEINQLELKTQHLDQQLQLLDDQIRKISEKEQEHEPPSAEQ
jgi:peptidoglycan hydrolase CwlO-like protein